jgi:hypothetical protein
MPLFCSELIFSLQLPTFLKGAQLNPRRRRINQQPFATAASSENQESTSPAREAPPRAKQTPQNHPSDRKASNIQILSKIVSQHLFRILSLFEIHIYSHIEIIFSGAQVTVGFAKHNEGKIEVDRNIEQYRTTAPILNPQRVQKSNLNQLFTYFQ